MSITHAHALMLYRACDGGKGERADSKNPIALKQTCCDDATWLLLGQGGWARPGARIPDRDCWRPGVAEEEVLPLPREPGRETETAIPDPGFGASKVS